MMTLAVDSCVVQTAMKRPVNSSYAWPADRMAYTSEPASNARCRWTEIVLCCELSMPASYPCGVRYEMTSWPPGAV
eukprot:scaffold13267_cov96-Isochrysis_galbana.AAC.4